MPFFGRQMNQPVLIQVFFYILTTENISFAQPFFQVELESRMKELQAARESRLELESRLKAEAHDKQAVAIAEVTRLQAELRAMRDHMETTVAKSVEAEKRTIQEKFLVSKTSKIFLRSFGVPANGGFFFTISP